MKRLYLPIILMPLIAGVGILPASAGVKIALLDSANTKAYFAAHYPDCSPPTSYYLGANEYQRYFRGWQWVLGTNNVGFNIVHDGDITADGLAPYELLILSNDARLSDDQSRAVQKWVIGGGRLLATFGSGYEDVVSDPRQLDGSKLQKGGTFGLHELWHDPITKLFSSNSIAPADPNVPVSVNVRITKYQGPTAVLLGNLTDNFLHYGALANILVQRPDNYPDALAYLIIGNANWKASTPAIISTRCGKGLVVYFAFAPEYIVYKELEDGGLGGLPTGWLSCNDGQNWIGRSTELIPLMMGTLHYLLTN